MKTCLIFIISSGLASAATVTQTANFTFSRTLVPGETDYSDPALFVTTVAPFDSSLGTLLSATIIWEVSGGMVASLPTGGGVSHAFGGPVALDGLSIGGFGGGNGGGGAPGTLLDLPLSTDPAALYSEIFIDSTNTQVWATITGTESYTASWDFDMITNIGGGEGTISADADVSVIYNYTPIPEPTTSALALLSALSLLSRRRRHAIA